MAPITYCIFSAQFRPVIGGVENYTHYLAEKMAQQGNNVIVVTSSLTGHPTEERLPSGVTIYRLPSLPLGKGRLPFLYPSKTTNTVFAMLKTHPNLRIIIQTRLYPLCLAAAQFAKKQGLPAIVIEHGSTYTKTGIGPVDLVLKGYVRLLFLLIRRYHFPFYAVSSSAAAAIATKGISVAGLLHNAVSIDAIKNVLTNNNLSYKKKYNLPSSAFVVCYAGRIIPQKGVPNLIAAIEIARQKTKSDIRLFVAGSGDITKKKDWLIPLGSLPFEEVIPLYQQADLFCLPTNMEEGFPTSALEAGACGTLVLANGKGGLVEMIPSAEYGIITQDNTPETLAAAIVTIINTPKKEIDTIRYRFKKRVETLYSFDALDKTIRTLQWF